LRTLRGTPALKDSLALGYGRRWSQVWTPQGSRAHSADRWRSSHFISFRCRPVAKQPFHFISLPTSGEAVISFHFVADQWRSSHFISFRCRPVAKQSFHFISLPTSGEAVISFHSNQWRSSHFISFQPVAKQSFHFV
jgi:hypothetical protein